MTSRDAVSHHPKMKTVFFSYARADKPRAIKIIRSLESHGVKVWWDSKLVGGEEFRDRIEQQLDSADHIVVLWTPNSVKSKFVRDEANRGLRSNKLVPIRLEDVQLPIGFGETHTIDCHDTIDELLLALGLPKSAATTADKEPIRLSKVQRLILINQYEIKALLDPESADQDKNTITALRNGYLDRLRIFDWLYDELEPSIHKDVFEILEMFRTLAFSYADLSDKKGIKKSDLVFRGFDGNNEAEYLGYAQFILKNEGLYQELQSAAGYNSHWPMMPKYVAMLREWEAISKKRTLSKAEILKMVNARTDDAAWEKYLPNALS